MITEIEALQLIRSLDGSPGYPFHAEAERRMAAILKSCVTSSAHAHAVIEEFDNGFPTAEQLRSAARVTGEICQCGTRRYDHAANGCKQFVLLDESAPTDRELSAAYHELRQSVPLIPGVRWEVCLQIQTIRIDLGMCGSPADHERLARDERDFPEAVSAIRAGRAPDPKLVEGVLSKRIPGWAREVKQ